MKPGAKRSFSIPFRRAARSADTLLFITPTRLIRADFSGTARAPVLDQIFEAGSPPSSEGLAVLADAAFALGPVTRRTVYILTTFVISQNLMIAKAKTQGLERADLQSALGFEAESMSGLNPFDSALGAVLAGQEGSDSIYWISQMSLGELNELRSGFARKRVDLRGVLHPGGLPRSLADEPSHSESRSWQRLEIWPEHLICLAGAPDSIKAHLIGVPPTRVGWRSEVEQWFEPLAEGQSRQCLAPDAQLLSFGEGGGYSLSEDAVLKAWLTGWALELTAGVPRVPVIVPARAPMADRRRFAIAGAVAVGVAGICGLHSMWMQGKARRLEGELARMQLPINHLAALKAREDQLATESARRQAEAMELRELQSIWADTLLKEQHRHANFLAAIADAAPLNLMVTGIAEQPGLVQLTALSTTPESSGFVTNLASRMNPLGWHLEPPSRRALNLQEDGGPWALSFVLKPAVAPAMGGIPNTPELPVLVPVPLRSMPDTNAVAKAGP